MMMDSEYNHRLTKVFDDVMVQFPVVARKVLMATKSKKSPVSSGIQYRLLESLMGTPMTPSDISYVHGISKPNVTTVISKLIQGGFVQRSHDENDRRVIYISITDKGKKIVLRRRAVVKKYLLKVYEQLDSNEMEHALAAMDTFKNLLSQMNSIM
jgi:DNA-binding MarR family transcriptional regulator